MFGWFSKKRKLNIGDIRATTGSPFLESLTVAIIIDIKKGYVAYSFCDLTGGEWVPRSYSINSETVGMFRFTFKNLLEAGNE